jgi:hypothetical protein
MKLNARGSASRLSLRPRTVVVLLALAAAGFACRDITAPTPARSSQPPTALLNPVGRVVVTSDSMRGWVFYDDQHDTPCASSDVCRLVQGPIGEPAGAGSAELAAPTATDGNALILPDYLGTRLDRFTELRYSTYRQSGDPGNNVAIALQFNADYDLVDQFTGYQGRLVFEPYQGIGGNVPQNAWQTWDATAGRWWGTRASVRRNNVVTANPCVQSSPCTWAQLLAAFPDAGVHATYGAIVLKAGSGWAGFRGNVDELTVGVGGAVTTFDFEGAPPTARLHTRIGDGVLGTKPPADSQYALGATVAYEFSPAPGHDGPWVVLDDTLAAASGTITMDKAHTLEVESDTIYTIDGLSDDGKEISRRIGELLTTGAKVRLYRDLIQFFSDRLDAGADPKTLARDNALAWYLTIDPARDSAAVAAVDDALNGYAFTVRWSEPDNRHYVDWSAPLQPGAPTPSRAPSPPATRAPARRSIGALTGPSRTVLPADQVDSPHEMTTFLYVNGMFTKLGIATEENSGAAYTASLLAKVLKEVERFKGPFTAVTFVYNKTVALQMAEYDLAHPCTHPSVRDIVFHGAIFTEIGFAKCKVQHFVKNVTSHDFVESATARFQLWAHLPPTNPQVVDIGNKAKELRDQGSHVIFVGHSEGTLLVAQAIRTMARPIQVAPTCVASLALATPTDRGTYDLDDPYKLGFILRGDIITLTAPTGWEVIGTAVSEAARARIAAARAGPGGEEAELLEIWRVGMDIHSIDGTYLADPGSVVAIKDRAVQLHKECVQQELTLTPMTQAVSAGSEFTVTPHVYNQNGRELFGRIRAEYSSPALPAVLSSDSSHRYRARTPRDTLEEMLYVGAATNVLSEAARVDVPLVPIAGASYVVKDSSWWELIAASNGGLGDPPYGWEQGPSSHWDGLSPCEYTETIYGRTGWGGQSYGTFLLHCTKDYVVNLGTVSDPEVAAQVEVIYSRTFHKDAPCGWQCVSYILVDAIDSLGKRVATSGPMIVNGPGPLASRQPSAPPPRPSSGVMSRPALLPLREESP